VFRAAQAIRAQPQPASQLNRDCRLKTQLFRSGTALRHPNLSLSYSSLLQPEFIFGPLSKNSKPNFREDVSKAGWLVHRRTSTGTVISAPKQKITMVLGAVPPHEQPPQGSHAKHRVCISSQSIQHISPSPSYLSMPANDIRSAPRRIRQRLVLPKEKKQNSAFSCLQEKVQPQAPHPMVTWAFLISS
jgi:hypothetical protein